MNIEVCREIAARLWQDRAMCHLVVDVPTCERIAQELFQYLNEFKVGDTIVCRWPGMWLNGMLFKVRDIGYYTNLDGGGPQTGNLTLSFASGKDGHIISGCIAVPRKYCKKYLRT